MEAALINSPFYEPVNKNIFERGWDWASGKAEDVYQGAIKPAAEYVGQHTVEPAFEDVIGPGIGQVGGAGIDLVTAGLGVPTTALQTASGLTRGAGQLGQTVMGQIPMATGPALQGLGRGSQALLSDPKALAGIASTIATGGAAAPALGGMFGGGAGGAGGAGGILGGLLGGNTGGAGGAGGAGRQRPDTAAAGLGGMLSNENLPWLIAGAGVLILLTQMNNK
jgi:hypothetical protein